MPAFASINFKDMTIDGVDFIDVKVIKSVPVKKGDTIQWTVRNQSKTDLTNVGVIDFAPTQSGGTAFSAGPPPVIANLPAKTSGQLGPIMADGDPDTYEYSIVADGLLVKDPEMVLDP
jgi:hypothetical protein